MSEEKHKNQSDKGLFQFPMHPIKGEAIKNANNTLPNSAWHRHQHNKYLRRVEFLLHPS
jgi:hypothetical protein